MTIPNIWTEGWLLPSFWKQVAAMVNSLIGVVGQPPAEIGRDNCNGKPPSNSVVVRS